MVCAGAHDFSRAAPQSPLSPMLCNGGSGTLRFAFVRVSLSILLAVFGWWHRATLLRQLPSTRIGLQPVKPALHPVKPEA